MFFCHTILFAQSVCIEIIYFFIFKLYFQKFIRNMFQDELDLFHQLKKIEICLRETGAVTKWYCVGLVNRRS